MQFFFAVFVVQYLQRFSDVYIFHNEIDAYVACQKLIYVTWHVSMCFLLWTYDDIDYITNVNGKWHIINPWKPLSHVLKKRVRIWRRRLCPTDDLMKKNSQQTSIVAEFGNSWVDTSVSQVATQFPLIIHHFIAVPSIMCHGGWHNANQAISSC